jgi:hypothetical protein
MTSTEPRVMAPTLLAAAVSFMRVVAIDTTATAASVRKVVIDAVRRGTITRTLDRACPVTITVSINRGDPEELPHVD